MTDYPVTPGNLWEPPGIPGSPQDPTVAGSRRFLDNPSLMDHTVDKYQIWYYYIFLYFLNKYLRCLSLLATLKRFNNACSSSSGFSSGLTGSSWLKSNNSLFWVEGSRRYLPFPVEIKICASKTLNTVYILEH